MSPILTGVIASGISGHLTPPWSPEGAYDALATVSVGSGGVATVEFIGIPNNYKHLEIRSISRGATSDDSTMRLNGDTNTSYRWHSLEGNGSIVYGTNNGASAANTFYFARTPNGSTAGANIFNASIVTILDYASTTKNKTIKTLGGTDYNGSGTITLWSALYLNTNPITSISIQVQSGNMAQYSQFALYGVK